MADNKDKKVLNVPHLRFPEFSGEWEKYTIGDLCEEFKSGKNIKAESIQEEGVYPVFGGNGLRGYTDRYNHDGDYVLIGRQGALCGNVRFVTGKTYITEHAIAAKATNDNYTRYLEYLFVRLNLGQFSDQSAQPGLAVNKLLKIETYVPSKAEQLKIAFLLRLLDERIATQNKIIEKLVSGGMIEPDFAFPYLQKQQFDIILAADRGLEFCYHYQIMPTYILGDFDSLSPEILNYYKENHVAPIREFNPMKDNTDTDIAFQQAIVLGSSEITILGATGGRLDHFLSIVQNLKTAWEKKIPAYIVDSRNLITIPVETSFEIRKEEQFGKYVSFFPLEKEVASITLEGFAYPLDHHYLPNTSGGLCVSNEIVEETAHVSYEGGILLMVQSRD